MPPTDSSNTANHWEPPSPEHLQQMLPQYEITAILGRGGMGAVYRGRQSKLDRPVAIKVLPETISKSDDEMNYAARFLQEARAMAKLDHPAIISVHDFGETPEGQLYFVMEFVDGMDIHQYLHHHGGRLPQEQALAIVAHVLDALAYAHDHGIVHRDIKPANILLNHEGRVKIADFGLAKKFGDTSGDSVPALTMTNVAVGTPDFVAPEALEAGRVVDHRADLYAVGVMLYQLLTGKLPRGSFQMPSVLVPEIDPRLDEIVTKATASDPDYRYESASALRADLDRIFSQPMTRIEPGDDSADVPVAVPVAESAKAASSSVGKAPSPGGPPRSNTPALIGIGVGVAALSVLAWIILANRSSADSAPVTDALPSTKPADHPRPSQAVAPPPRPVVPDSTPSVTPPEPPAPTAVAATAPATTTPAEPTAVETPPATSAGSLGTSTAPLAPAIPGTPDLTPGQWVELFATEQELPESLRGTGNKRSARFEDGWIRSALPGVQLNLPLPLDRAENYGVRARFRLSDEDTSSHGIVIRVQEDPRKNQFYQIRFDLTGAVNLQRRDEGQYANLARTPAALAPNRREFTLQLAVFGDRLVGRFENDPPIVITDGTFPGGGARIYVNETAVRDIAVVLLDGLPETDIMRLLGIAEPSSLTSSVSEPPSSSAAPPVPPVTPALDAAPASAPAPPTIPELRALHEQFEKLEGERVIATFNADVAKLNAGYIGGIDRKIATEKSAGHLDGVLALEEEKRRVLSSPPASDPVGRHPAPSAIPSEDAEADPATLKELRKVYRDAFARLETARAANRKLLTDPLDTRLQQLETELTRQDRIADAKAVREYRARLATSATLPVVATPPTAAPQAPGQKSPAPARFSKGDDRKAAEWVLSLGGGGYVEIRSEDGKVQTIRKLEDLPADTFSIVAIDLAFFFARPNIEITNLVPLARLSSLSSLRITGPYIPDAAFEILPTLPLLDTVRLVGTKNTDDSITYLKECRSLQTLIIEDNASFKGERLSELAGLKLRELGLKATGINSSFLSAVGGLRDLDSLAVWYNPLSDAAIASLQPLTRLTTLNLAACGCTSAALPHLKPLKNLETFAFEAPLASEHAAWTEFAESHSKVHTLRLRAGEKITREDLVVLRQFKVLRQLQIMGQISNEAAMAALDLPDLVDFGVKYGDGAKLITPVTFIELASHKKITILEFENALLFDDAALAALTGMKQLKSLTLTNASKLTPAAIAAFKKERPDVEFEN